MDRPSISLPTLFTILGMVVSVQGQSQTSRPRNPSRIQGVLGTGLAPTYYPPLLLLERQEVQKELKMTAAQKDRLKAVEKERDQALERQSQESREFTGQLRARGDAQGLATAREQFNAARKEILDRSEAAMLKVLDRPQRKRLGQIQLQAEGPISFKRPEIQRRLNLAPEQIASIALIDEQGREDLYREADKKADPVPSRTSLTSEEIRTLKESKAYQSMEKATRDTATQVRRKTMQLIAKVLTKKQRGIYENMRGEPFEFGNMRGEATTNRPGEAPEK